MSTDYLSRIIVPVPRGVWEQIYGSAKGVLPTQSPAWAAAIVEGGSYRDASRLYEFRDGSRAILPLFRGRLNPFPILRSPPPAWGFGGLLSDGVLTKNQVRAVMKDLASLPSLWTRIRPSPLEATLWLEAAGEGWSAIPRIAHVLDLSGGFDHVWSKRFKQDARNRVRRAERAGVEIVSGSSEQLIKEFHQLLRRSFERWGRMQHEPAALARLRGLSRDPEAKFRIIAKSAGDVFRLWIARVAGEPAAAILVLRDTEAHYTRGAMDEKLAGPSYANYLLHSKAIEEACKAGCTHYHMGETGNSKSLAQFKSRFGAVATPYAEYQFERLPISRIGSWARILVKSAVGFRDA